MAEDSENRRGSAAERQYQLVMACVEWFGSGTPLERVETIDDKADNLRIRAAAATGAWTNLTPHLAPATLAALLRWSQGTYGDTRLEENRAACARLDKKDKYPPFPHDILRQSKAPPSTQMLSLIPPPRKQISTNQHTALRSAWPISEGPKARYSRSRPHI